MFGAGVYFGSKKTVLVESINITIIFNFQSSRVKDSSVCTVSFNTKGKKQHQKATEALLQESNFSLAPPLLISAESDIEEISSLIALVFIDSSDKIDGTNDLKWKTVQAIGKMGGKCIIYNTVFGIANDRLF